MSLSSQVVNHPNLYVDGLIYTLTGNTTLTVTGGACRSYDNTSDIIISKPLTMIDASRPGVNGLDSGALEPSTVYALYAIGNTANQAISAFVVSKSQINIPYLPSNYNNIRRIGWLSTDSSSHFHPFVVSGSSNVRQVQFLKLTTLLSVVSSSPFASTDISSIYPSKVLPIEVSVSMTNIGGGPGNKAVWRPTGQTTTEMESKFLYIATAQESNQYIFVTTGINESGKCSIDTALVTVSGSQVFSFDASGFIDYL